MFWLAAIAFFLALLPAAMTITNIVQFRPPRKPEPGAPRPRVSLLIPARNEANSIEAAVTSALASEGVELEVVVLDDGSTDDTAAIVRRLAEADPRVRLHAAPPLPGGWCGKQHACWTLSKLATHDVLVWIDADVRLAPDALTLAAAYLDESDAPLVSGFPQQETLTPMEQLVVPLMHAVLLGYLPVYEMRRSLHPAFGAGCGQFFVARRAAYFKAGGHAAIRRSLHDGVTLPRAFRAAGFKTDLFDATDLATCRMYRTAGEVWRGFAKNATEGMATEGGIGVWTLLLLGGHVLPYVLLAAAALGAVEDAHSLTTRWIVSAAGLSFCTSLLVMWRFRQTWTSGLLRPIGVAVLVAIQWYALGRKLLGRPSGWKGRAYAVEG